MTDHRSAAEHEAAEQQRVQPALAELPQRLAALGVHITDADRAAAARRLATLQPVSDEQHAANLAWLDASAA